MDATRENESSRELSCDKRAIDHSHAGILEKSSQTHPFLLYCIADLTEIQFLYLFVLNVLSLIFYVLCNAFASLVLLNMKICQLFVYKF